MSSLTCTSPDTARLPVGWTAFLLPLILPLVFSFSSLPPAWIPLRLDRLITAKDHASIQIQVADVDSDGKAIKGKSTTIAICGRIRAQGDSDDSINRIATKEGCERSLCDF